MSEYNPFTLSGKRILVTGATSGIGKATAIECAKLGAHIIAVGRDVLKLADLKESLGSGHEYFSVELTNQDAISAFVKEIEKVDGLVNAAGIDSISPFPFLSKAKIQNMFDVNFFAPIELTRLLVKGKKISKGASIVFLSSVDGPMTGHTAHAGYSSTKAAISGAVKSLAVELAAKDIRVNYLIPGRTETPMIHAAGVSEEQLETEKNQYPLKRFARPEEIAYGAIYFLSDASSFTTGSGLVIDGGLTLT